MLPLTLSNKDELNESTFLSYAFILAANIGAYFVYKRSKISRKKEIKKSFKIAFGFY